MRHPDTITRDIAAFTNRLRILDELEKNPQISAALRDRCSRSRKAIDHKLNRLRTELAASQSIVWPGDLVTDGDVKRLRASIYEQRVGKPGPKRTRRQRRAQR